MSRSPSRSARAGARGVASSPAVAGFRPAIVAVAAALAIQAHAQTAVHGTATVHQNGSNTTVTTTNGAGHRSVINWQQFGVPLGATTHFAQPDALSTSINRVTGGTRSDILGTLSSNGRLVLVNPSGIAFGANASVDTAGFTASALGLSEADAIAGRLLFQGGSNKIVVEGDANGGARILANGGDIVLVGSQVQVQRNAVLQSNGATILAAGEKVEITGRGLEGIRMEMQAGNEALNLGTLKGDAVGIFANTLKHSGIIQANALTTEGGRVVLKAVGGDALVDGSITAKGNGGKGGAIDVLGQRVGLLAGATLDASGAKGGGSIRVGGDYQGSNPDVPNAKAVYVDEKALILADATERGDGGRVIVWSDDMTRMHGRISARGGEQGGNGGFAEVSGKKYLEYTGLADLRAPKGEMGSLLLDPQDVTIIDGPSGASTGTFPITETPPNAPTEPGSKFEPTNSNGSVTLTDGHLNTQLQTSHVIVKTDSDVENESGGQITVAAGADINWISGNHLKLQANKGIAVNGSITSTNASARLVLEALNGDINDGTTGAVQVAGLFATATGGSVVLDNGHNVGVVAGTTTTAGQSFVFNGAQAYAVGEVNTAWGNGSGISSGTVSLVSGDDLTIQRAVTGQAGGSVTMQAGRYLDVNAAVASNGGNIKLQGGTINSEGRVQVGTTGSLTSNGGQIELESLKSDAGGTSLRVEGAVNAAAGLIKVTAQSLDILAGGSIRRSSTGSGDIQLFVDSMNLAGAGANAIQSTNGRIVLNPLTPTGSQVAIIGNDTIGVDGAYNVYQGNLDKMSAKTLVIGSNTTTRSIAINGNVDLTANFQELSLITQASIAQDSTGTLRVAAVNLDGNTVHVDNAGNQVSTVSGRYNTEFTFASDTALTVDTVDGIVGVRTRGTPVPPPAPTPVLSITSAQALAINQDVDGVQVSLSGTTVNVAAGKQITATTGNASLSITATGSGANNLGDASLYSDGSVTLTMGGTTTLGNVTAQALGLNGGTSASQYLQKSGTAIQAGSLELDITTAGSSVELLNGGNVIDYVNGEVAGTMRVASQGDMDIGSIMAENVKLMAANIYGYDSSIEATGYVELKGTSSSSVIDVSGTDIDAGGNLGISTASDVVLGNIDAGSLSVDISGNLSQDGWSGDGSIQVGGTTLNVGGTVDLADSSDNELGYVSGTVGGSATLHGVSGVAAAGLSSGGDINLVGLQSILTFSVAPSDPSDLDLIGNVTAAGAVNLASSTQVLVQGTSAVSGTSINFDTPMTSVYGKLLPGGAGGIGAVTATGDLQFLQGGTMEMDVASLTSFDTLQVAGMAMTDSASAVMVKDLSGGTLSGSFQPTTLGGSSILSFALPQGWTVSSGQPYVITAAPAPAPVASPSPAPAPGTPRVEEAKQETNNTLTTFLDLFEQEVERQEDDKDRIGKDDIVVTDTACNR